METTNTLFSAISLHDSRVVSILSQPSRIEVHLRMAFLSPHHPANHSDGWLTVLPALLAFSGVTHTEARFWHDASHQWQPHPGTCPAIEGDIIESEFHDSDSEPHFYLTGFSSPGWTEWRIFTSTFELSWKSSQPSHHLPPRNA